MGGRARTMAGAGPTDLHYWGLARFSGPCPVDGVRAEEVLRVGTWTPSAIPAGEEILIRIWSTISRTDRFLRYQAPNRDEKFSPLLP